MDLQYVPLETPPAIVEWKRIVNDAYLLLADIREDAAWQMGVNEWLQHALSLAERVKATPVEEPRSSPSRAIEAQAIETMLKLTYAAWCLADDSEDLGDGYHKVDHDNFKALCDQLDALDDLPQDQPGYIMAPPAKAGWALRGSPSRERVEVLEEALRRGEEIIRTMPGNGSNWERVQQFYAAYSATLKAPSDG